MTTEEIKQWRLLLEAKANAEIDLIIFEKTVLPGQSVSKPKTKTKIEQFIEDNPGIDPDVLELLEKPEQTTDDLATYFNMHRNQIAKWLREGKYRPGPSDSKGKRKIDSISVVETILGINGETKKKQNG